MAVIVQKANARACLNPQQLFDRPPVALDLGRILGDQRFPVPRCVDRVSFEVDDPPAIPIVVEQVDIAILRPPAHLDGVG